MSRYRDIVLGDRRLRCIDLRRAAGGTLERMPVIHRILLENVLRTAGPNAEEFRASLLDWVEAGESEAEIAFLPGRVLMHDTTCGPALVDIAGLRSALAEAGGHPERLSPVLPVDVSTDHSIGVDAFGTRAALATNIAHELKRNAERYGFMKWAAGALNNFQVHPPGTGIMHTLNLERLATVVATRDIDGIAWAVPDTLIGTDSHTPMINGIGVLAWGVGGLEAESVMFGMPVSMRVPDVVGVRLVGTLHEGVLATDLALTVTQRLREIDLADRYVEFFGPGIASLSAGDRAVVANMTPEFGANTGYFPIDERTLSYLRATGRSDGHVALVESYARQQGLWHDPLAAPRYSETIQLDLGSVEASVAGPQRPQDRISAGDTARALAPLLKIRGEAGGTEIRDGAVAIAAITSCTNTSDPRLLVAAGLVARKARAFGFRPPDWVKTSLAPGSPTAERYLTRAGLLADLEAVGFAIVGYGCTTCIGNSGPLLPEVAAAIQQGITPVAVLSGNRNFPGRVHPQLEAGFLASPPLVVAMALAGTVQIDILKDPIGIAASGIPIRLADLWPSGAEIDAALALAQSPSDFDEAYGDAEASVIWAALPAPRGVLYPWDEASTYIRRPPFVGPEQGSRLGSYLAHPIVVLGDDVTTDHISPAGAISSSSDAGRHLVARGGDEADLNVFASRRGNWEVMLRGLFTNKTTRNLIAEELTPGTTLHVPSGQVMSLWQAAERYRRDGQSVVIVAGERYGMGSSRDWAAKGVALLGVRAVLAASFERIHRSNLIGMGVLPLRLSEGVTPASLGLRAGDRIEVEAPAETMAPRAVVSVRVAYGSGSTRHFLAQAAVETTSEVETLLAGGLLPQIYAQNLGSARVGKRVGR